MNKRFCPRCKEKLNPHTPKICPGCKLDLMAWLWGEVDNLRTQRDWSQQVENLTDTALRARILRLAKVAEHFWRDRDSWMEQAEARTQDGADVAGEVLELREEIDALRREYNATLNSLHEAIQERSRLMPLAVAVGTCDVRSVPESVWKAWQRPENYRQDELVRLRDREAELESQVARLTRQLADKTSGRHLQGWGTVVKTDPEKWMIMVSSEPCLTDAFDQIKEKVTGFIDPEPFKRVAVCPTAYFDGVEPLGWETCDQAPREKGTPCSTQNK